MCDLIHRKRRTSRTDLMRHKQGCHIDCCQQLSVRLADDVKTTWRVTTPLEPLIVDAFVWSVVH